MADASGYRELSHICHSARAYVLTLMLMLMKTGLTNLAIIPSLDQSKPVGYKFHVRPLYVSIFRIMTWICLVFVPLITACRMSRFTKEENVALENHLIKIVTADRPIKCREDCLDTPSCFSVNVHAQKLSSGWVTCDLNNSSKTADPQDLVPKRGYQYLPMAVGDVKKV